MVAEGNEANMLDDAWSIQQPEEEPQNVAPVDQRVHTNQHDRVRQRANDEERVDKVDVAASHIGLVNTECHGVRETDA